jgi:signal transduction histidine kinase
LPLLPTPQIRIRTFIEENRVIISIADNGSGMTEEVRKRLFDPFFTTKPVGKGTGMGLSISYQIVVNKHGGEIKCISASAKGAEFIIVIPLEKQA